MRWRETLLKESTMSRWLRFLLIVFTFIVVAPLIGATVAFLCGSAVSRPPLHQWLPLWLNWVVHAGYVAGGPIALVVGLLFGAGAVFLGWSSLSFALALAVVALLVLQIPFGAPIWEWGAWLAVTAALTTLIPTAVAWRISRSWHRPATRR
jgi:hypothetical protein